MLFWFAYQLQIFLLDVFDYFHNSQTKDEEKTRNKIEKVKCGRESPRKKNSEILKLKYYWF